MELDHEKLDVYRVALDFAAWAYATFVNVTSCTGTGTGTGTKGHQANQRGAGDSQ